MNGPFKLLGLLVVLGMIVACSGTSNNNITDDSMTTGKMSNTGIDNLYDFKMTSLEGKEIDLSNFKGKKLLIVNTASECGYTPQYAGLQELHEKHGDKVVVLGFPANNFGGQEPGSHEDIAAFCKKNYGVAFQMFEKISVAGEDKHPLYKWLTANAPNHEEPNWNFCKYLIDENGKVIAFYPSKVKPMDQEILAAIQK
jgi:glutathione peroxidase